MKPEKCPEGTSQTVVAATSDGGGDVQRERESGVFGFSTHAQSFQHMCTCLCVYIHKFTHKHTMSCMYSYMYIVHVYLLYIHTHVQCTCRCITMYMFIAMDIFSPRSF